MMRRRVETVAQVHRGAGWEGVNTEDQQLHQTGLGADIQQLVEQRDRMLRLQVELAQHPAEWAQEVLAAVRHAVELSAPG